MAGDGGRVPDVSEQRASHEAGIEAAAAAMFVPPISRDRIDDARAGVAAYLSHSDPASVLAALLAESPEATVAAIEALLTSERVIGRVARRIRQDSADTYDWRRVARWAMESACRSLLSKAPKGDG
jgi:hypothetical protein